MQTLIPMVIGAVIAGLLDSHTNHELHIAAEVILMGGAFYSGVLEERSRRK